MDAQHAMSAAGCAIPEKMPCKTLQHTWSWHAPWMPTANIFCNLESLVSGMLNVQIQLKWLCSFGGHIIYGSV